MNFLNSCSGKKIKFNPIHQHECWELIRLDAEKAFYYTKGQTYVLSEGDLILIPPDTPHNCEYQEYFSDSFIQFSSCTFPQKPIMIRDIDGNIGKLFCMVVKLYIEKEFHYKEIIENLLETILCFIEKSTKTEITYPFVYALKDSLYENLSNPAFNIGKAISEIGYTQDYFRHCFKAEFGKSPLEYLTTLRLTKAKRLLVQDDFISIENVATQCGFSDSFYFSTCFKKHRGISPLQYRKMKLNEKKR